MLFNSIEYLIFFPIVLLVYFLLPKKIRYIWLLAASYYFYMCWYPKHVFLLFFSTVVTYLCAVFISAFRNNLFLRKLCFVFCIAANLIVLIYFKYRVFFFNNISALLSLIGIDISAPDISFMLPIGISFYIFQALGYLIDVYRGSINAEKNFFKYAINLF